ncbi:MAG TPA: MFS transporter [Hyphomicrobiales bacterium]|nr:MFS transporter [Hyphomicrobiales bacterium]
MSTGKEELFKNWPILVVAFLLIFFAFGVPNYSMPWMYRPAMDEFGWSNAQVNMLATAKFVIGAIAALGMGIMVDKIGAKVAVLIGTVSGGAALAMFWFATSLPIYYLAGGLLGLSASSIVAAMKIVLSRLFTIHQGLAVGIVLSGTTLGGIVMPLVWVPMLEIMNWRSIATFMSLGAFLIAVPLWLIFMSRTGAVQDSINSGSKEQGDGTGLWEHFKQISRDKGFAFIVLGIFLTSAVDQAMMQNYVNILSADNGVVLSNIAWAGSFMGVLGVVARIGSGWFYDRFSIFGIRISYFLLALSVFLILPVAGVMSLFLFITARGVAHGGLIVEAPVLAKHYLGARNLGMTIGVISVFINMGFAVGPPVLGHFADVNGDFKLGILIYGCLALVGLALLLPIKPRYWTPPSQRKQELAGDAAQVPPEPRPAGAAG